AFPFGECRQRRLVLLIEQGSLGNVLRRWKWDCHEAVLLTMPDGEFEVAPQEPGRRRFVSLLRPFKQIERLLGGVARTARTDDADALVLARLAAAKLAKLVRGWFTVATAALETDRPLAFLAGRERPPLAFIEVLASLAHLRHRAEALADSAREIHARLVELA